MLPDALLPRTVTLAPSPLSGPCGQRGAAARAASPCAPAPPFAMLGLLQRRAQTALLSPLRAPFATHSASAPDVFDREAKAAHRDRSAYLASRSGAREDPLSAACAENLLDRLRDVVRKFQTCLVLGGAGAPSQRLLAPSATFLPVETARCAVCGVCRPLHANPSMAQLGRWHAARTAEGATTALSEPASAQAALLWSGCSATSAMRSGASRTWTSRRAC